MTEASKRTVSKVRQPEVAVLMATYNGEHYVADQIASILAQTAVNITLLISDDKSNDQTPVICERLAEQDPRIKFRTNESNLGVAVNFLQMVKEIDASKYDFFAFSDQDDYWLPEKLSKAIELMGYSDSEPRLYYSDVSNTDSELNGGEREYESFAPYAKSLKSLLLVNWASGCTFVFNRPLCRLLKEDKGNSYPRIHDAWVHLVALSVGTTYPDLENAYIKRRITGSNQVGIQDFGKWDKKKIMSMLTNLLKPSRKQNTKAAWRLLSSYGTYMDNKVRATVETFASMPTSMSSRLHVAFDAGYALPSKRMSLQMKAKAILNRL